MILLPNEDVTADWTETPTGPAWAILARGAVSPDTSEKVASTTSGQVCTVGLGTKALRDGEQVSSIAAHIYAKATTGTLSLSIGAGSTPLPLGLTYSATSYGWVTVSYDGPLDQGELDSLRATIISASSGIAGVAVEVAALYVVLETEPRRERIVLDPVELAPERTELVLGEAPIMVGEDGPEWGNAEIAAFMAEQTYGETPIGYRVPNRQVSIPLVINADSHADFEEARTALQAKAGRLRDEGGWIRRETALGDVLYGDVVNATLNLPGGTLQAQRNIEPEGTLVLECLPDFHGPRELINIDHTETTKPELIFPLSSIKGHIPARMELIVDDDNNIDQRGLIAALRYLDDAPSARMAYEAEALTPLDLATSGAFSGASGGSAVTHATVGTEWTPMLSTYVAGVGDMTHSGTYRLLARVNSPYGSQMRFRVLYDVGDLKQPAENPAWRYSGDTSSTNFYIADLGELQLQSATVGTHRWAGVIQAACDTEGGTATIDRLWIVPAERMVRCSAPITSTAGLSADIARDGFNQTAGALTGKSVPTGGTWQGAGDADDYALDTTNHKAERTATSDADRYTGRWANPSAAAALGATVVKADIAYDIATPVTGDRFHGVFARYTDANNWIAAGISDNDMTGTASYPDLRFVIAKRVAGTPRVFYAGFPIPASSMPYLPWATVLLSVDAAGQIMVQFSTLTVPPVTVLTFLDPDLAQGGALATGKAGIYDVNTSATAITRTFDNVRIYSPPTDAAVFAARTAQITSEGCFRDGFDGMGYGPISVVEGALPRLPVSGPENRQVECFVKLSRGDLDALPDSGIDDLSAQVAYRPSYLFVPES